MPSSKRLITAASHVGRARIQADAALRRLEETCDGWLAQVRRGLDGDLSPARREDLAAELAAALSALFAVAGDPAANRLLGRVLSALAELERGAAGAVGVMRRLLDPAAADRAEAESPRILVINPGSTSTKVAYFEGLAKRLESEVHLPPDAPDGTDERAAGIEAWMREQGLAAGSLDAIACRGGFLAPVPGGTYRVVPEMLRDLDQARIQHASNMSVFIGQKLAELSGRGDDMLVTTSDAVVTDEMELVERLTGWVDQKLDGSGAHYLNHKAVWRMLSSMLGRAPEATGAITAHLGGGMSVARHRDGEILALVDAFSGIPSANRSGCLDLPRLLAALKKDEVTVKQLEEIVLKRGGLLSLAGTNDFRALSHFRHQGATEAQREKIDLVHDFYARKIASSILRLSADGEPVVFVALTGGLARSEEIVGRVEASVAGRFPMVRVPGSVEHESLAAGALRGLYAPDGLRDYLRERDNLKSRREAEDRLIDTTIFERKLITKGEGAPITTVDELIAAACATVEQHFAPAIGIVGAENEDAILAAKRANEEGRYRLANFQLIGDYAAINEIAYEYDLVIDGKNYAVVDSEEPVDKAVEMMAAGDVQILMKGSMKTEKILHGVFRFLKDSGRLKPGELISHVVVMDIPRRNKLLIISDAAVNTYPDEAKRIKILENTLKVARSLNVRRPKVAVISAIEAVNPSVESSIEAERIAKHFAGRDDCIVEGPLSFDVAMDPESAAEKKYAGQVAGTADVLIMPDIDAGNVLYKTLTTQSGATCAGVIIAGDTPMVLTSRGDSARSKLASISLAVKLFFELKKGAGS